MKIPDGVVRMIYKLVEEQRAKELQDHKENFWPAIQDIDECYVDDGYADGMSDELDPFYKHILKFMDIVNDNSVIKYG